MLQLVKLLSLFGIVNCVFCTADQKFQQDTVSRHNFYRAKHGVPDLTLNNTINSFAQEWADELAKTNTFAHRSNNIYGENLYMTTGTLTANAAVDLFYAEVAQYDYANPGFSSATGHFTQVVWKNSRQLGVGLASKNGYNYVVCNYSPPGNYQGQFASNVPKLIS